MNLNRNSLRRLIKEAILQEDASRAEIKVIAKKLYKVLSDPDDYKPGSEIGTNINNILFAAAEELDNIPALDKKTTDQAKSDMELKTTAGTEGQSIINILKNFVSGLKKSKAPKTAEALAFYIEMLEDNLGGSGSTGAKKKKSGISAADIQDILNKLLEEKGSQTKIKTDGKWGKNTQKAYDEVMDKYYPKGKGKSWKSIAPTVKEKTNMNGMFAWLSSFYQAEKLNKSGKVKKPNVNKQSDAISSENKGKVRDLLKKQKFSKLDDNLRKKLANATGSKSNKIVHIETLVKPTDVNKAKDKVRALGGKVEITAATDDQKTFIVIGSKNLEESFGLSRGSLYRQRYRRY
jgi:hypothetical protein